VAKERNAARECATEYWAWGIDNVIPMPEIDTLGIGKGRKDCMRQFRAASDKFSSDHAG